MLRRPTLVAIQGAHLASLLPEASRFHRACRCPERSQGALVRSVLTQNAQTDFGRKHRLEMVDSVSAFRARVPRTNYEDLRPWVERSARGLSKQLTRQRVIAFEPTSGSSRAKKWIPYTQGLLGDFNRATAPWLFDMFLRRPQLWGTTSYWAVSAASGKEQLTEGGIPVGLRDDTEYFGPLQRWAIARTLAVDPKVGQIEEHARWQRETARQLLLARDLGFVSVWHPSYFTLLLDAIDEHFDSLLSELPLAERQRLQRVTSSSERLAPTQLWPQLSLVSCWTDGPARSFLPELQRRVPGVEVQGKGLMATEGVISIPLTVAAHPVLALTSHFFEFVDVQAERTTPLLAHELRPGADYRPLLTTHGGLYRYDLGDRVRCRGFYRGAPLLSFEGRWDARSDLRGEKLDAAFVQQTLEAACAEGGLSPVFMLLAPSEREPPGYLLFVECPAAGEAGLNALGAAVEAGLRCTHHYDLCRRLGQLAPLQLRPVRDGQRRYQEKLMTRGMRQGDIKPNHLATERFWGDVFKDADNLGAPSSSAAGLR